MDNKQMGPRNMGFVLSEAQGSRSREQIIIASGAGVLQPGTVLGKVTATGKYVASPDAGADGSQTGIAVLAYRTDATAADADAVAYVRDCEVKTAALAYEATVNDTTKEATKHAQLEAVGIIVR